MATVERRGRMARTSVLNQTVVGSNPGEKKTEKNERKKQNNGHLGLFKTDLTVSTRSEIILLAVKYPKIKYAISDRQLDVCETSFLLLNGSN
jgi:hypothetical protein